MGKKVLYLQIIGGISGDMFLALMADLGVDLKELEKVISEVVPVEIHYQKRRKMGFSGTVVDVLYNKEQKLRKLKDLISIIDRLSISKDVKDKSIRALEKLAHVEASVHGVSIDDVHFHEIGAVDTIVDVVGCFFCLEKLSIDSVYSSKIPLFEGYIECSHGNIPLPAPATLKLLNGKPVYFTHIQKELVTPTGALILDMVVDSFVDRPSGILSSDGYGIGHMDLDIPNVLRGMLIEVGGHFYGKYQEEEICVLETNVDHLTSEEIGDLFEVVLKNGALDLFYFSGIGKKNRPSGIIQILCYEHSLDKILDIAFKYTLTLGIRINKVKRVVLDRFISSINTKMGDLNIKEFKYKENVYKRAEYDSIKSVCDYNNMSPIELRLKLMENGFNFLNKEDNMEYTEKVRKRLEHWLEHNAKHMEEYKKLADELKEKGYESAANYILNLIEHTKKMNDEINNALNNI